MLRYKTVTLPILLVTSVTAYAQRAHVTFNCKNRDNIVICFLFNLPLTDMQGGREWKIPSTHSKRKKKKNG